MAFVEKIFENPRQLHNVTFSSVDVKLIMPSFYHKDFILLVFIVPAALAQSKMFRKWGWRVVYLKYFYVPTQILSEKYFTHLCSSLLSSVSLWSKDQRKPLEELFGYLKYKISY